MDGFFWDIRGAIAALVLVLLVVLFRQASRTFRRGVGDHQWLRGIIMARYLWVFGFLRGLMQLAFQSSEFGPFRDAAIL